jgi:hypothetical protein
MSKTVRYATNDDKVSKEHVSVESTQTSLQTYITWPKKFGMLIILNIGIVVVDLGIAMDFDVDISIYVMDCS